MERLLWNCLQLPEALRLLFSTLRHLDTLFVFSESLFIGQGGERRPRNFKIVQDLVCVKGKAGQQMLGVA
jgi:hypothetical protein